MPIALLLPLLLRLAGPIAFVIAAITAGVLNRSVMMIPLLALMATATTIFIRMVSPLPSIDLQSALSAEAAPGPASPFKGAGRRLLIGLFGYGAAFGLAALIAALFQTTEFQREVSLEDLGFFVVPAVIAVIGALIGVRLGMSKMAGMMAEAQNLFAQMQASQQGDPAPDDPFTVDGEIIDPDPDKPDS